MAGRKITGNKTTEVGTWTLIYYKLLSSNRYKMTSLKYPNHECWFNVGGISHKSALF